MSIMVFVVDNPNLYCTVVELRKVCILVLTYKEIELLHVKILCVYFAAFLHDYHLIIILIIRIYMLNVRLIVSLP